MKRVCVMVVAVCAVVAVMAVAAVAGVASGHYWLRIRDGYRLHMAYADRDGFVLGDFYQPRAGEAFTAQCWKGKPVELPNLKVAQAFVQACPE